MSVGNLRTYGNKGNNFPFQLRVLQLLSKNSLGALTKEVIIFTPGPINIPNTLTHNLNTVNIDVQLWDVITNNVILTNVTIGNPTANTIDITFSVNPAGNVRAVIIG